MEQGTPLPHKNTFIHFQEPSSPSAPPPTFSAPGQMQEKIFRVKEAPEPPPSKPSTFRRLAAPKWPKFRSSKQTTPQLDPNVDAAARKPPPAGTATASRMNASVQSLSLQQSRQTYAPAQDVPPPPSPNTNLPGCAGGNPFFQVSPSEGRGCAGGPPAHTKPCAQSAASAGINDQVVVAHAPLNRNQMHAPSSAAATDAVPLSKVMEGKRCGHKSVGSSGHSIGQCIPCLMEVRYQAGKCPEPCRYELLCGRCHEAHTEEELQKIQAKMRKLKKKGGAPSAALLSAAYAAGQAAPVGGGAGKGVFNGR